MPIDSHLSYLEKHRSFPRQIDKPPADDLEMIIVIPAFAEPDLKATIYSLMACHPPKCGVEVIVVINHSEKASERHKELNEKQYEELQNLAFELNSFFELHVIFARELKKKKAGVGAARKIGMDEAVDRFVQIGQDDGLILCLDADSKVAKNYLVAIKRFFHKYPKQWACAIYFEHPLAGKQYPDEVYKAIVGYELHLRYYIEALRYAGHPYAFHTVGSSMAVRAGAYEKMGGMNRRKAGEDFYFLQKFIRVDRLGELNDTCVFPSPRPSFRVPFGTGKAVQQHLDKEEAVWHSYAFVIFEQLKEFIAQIPSWYTHDPSLSLSPAWGDFLEQEQFIPQIHATREHVASEENFVKRFFTWFDALKVLRLIHYLSDNEHPQVPLLGEANKLRKLIQDDQSIEKGEEGLLAWYRDHQRGEIKTKRT